MEGDQYWRKRQFYLLGLTLLIVYLIIKTIHSNSSLNELEMSFQKFLITHNKIYPTREEFVFRLENFKKSIKQIQKLNGLQPLGEGQESITPYEILWQVGIPKNRGRAQFGLNKFADMSPHEFKTLYLSQPHVPLPRSPLKWKARNESRIDQLNAINFFNVTLPLKVDWREKRAVSRVNDQKNCGNCWAWSTAQTVESMEAIQNHHKVESLSVQQLTDCIIENGCDRGMNPHEALNWLLKHKLLTATDYPSINYNENEEINHTDCREVKPQSPGVQVDSFVANHNFVRAEDKLMRILAFHGPMTVGLSSVNLRLYVGGIIGQGDFSVCPRSNKQDHAVQIVGYDLSDPAFPEGYYIVRNSWGEDYGDGGYFYLSANSNLCGVAADTFWLNVA